MLYNMLYNIYGQDCVCLVAPFPNNPNPPEEFNVNSDMDFSRTGLMWYARPQLWLLCFNCTLPHWALRQKEQAHGAVVGILQHL